MLKSLKIAVTGGLASGKTTVCRILKELGAYTVDADTIVHQLLSLKSDIEKNVIELLGAEIISGDQIDRTKVADIVFKNPNLLKALEQILHPQVQKVIDQEYDQVASRVPLFVAEVPLLFEANLQPHFDAVIAVTADPAHARERFAAKTGYDPTEYDRRTSRLLPQEEKARRAHYHLINNGTTEELKKNVKQIYENLAHNR